MILALLQLPPPMHGASLRNSEYACYLRERYRDKVRVVDIGGKGQIAEVGRASFAKIWHGLTLIARLLLLIIRHRSRIAAVYITPAAEGLGMWRDAVLVFFSATLVGVRVVSHFRSMGFSQVGGLKRACLRLLYGRSFAIAMSQRVSEDLWGIVARSRIQIIQNGLAEYFNPDEHRVVRDGTVVLHLSNLSREKGAFDVLEAFAGAAAQNRDCKLVMAGGWSSEVERVAFMLRVDELELSGRVDCVGPVRGAEKWRLFARSDVFLFPTTYKKECFPGVVMEAMSAGMAVVTYNHAAIPDIIEHGRNGLRVPAGEVTALGSALHQVLCDATLRDGISQAALADFKAKYRSSITHPMITQFVTQGSS